MAPACARCESNGGQQLVNTSYYHAALSVPVPSWQLNTSWGANGLLTRFDNVMQALWVLMQVRAGDTSAGGGNQDLQCSDDQGLRCSVTQEMQRL